MKANTSIPSESLKEHSLTKIVDIISFGGKDIYNFILPHSSIIQTRNSQRSFLPSDIFKDAFCTKSLMSRSSSGFGFLMFFLVFVQHRPTSLLFILASFFRSWTTGFSGQYGPSIEFSATENLRPRSISLHQIAVIAPMVSNSMFSTFITSNSSFRRAWIASSICQELSTQRLRFTAELCTRLTLIRYRSSRRRSPRISLRARRKVPRTDRQQYLILLQNQNRNLDRRRHTANHRARFSLVPKGRT